MARRVLTIGIPALAAYTFYTSSRLLSEYPIERRLAPYHQLPSVIPILAKAKGKEFGDIDVVYARIPLPARARSGPAAPSPPASPASSASALASPSSDPAAPSQASYRPKPLDQLLSAFWSTWTLHVEHHLAALFLGSSIPPDMLGPEAQSSTADGQEAVAFAGAIFPIWRYYPDSVVFQWRFSPAMGGVQELAAVIKEQPGDQAAEKEQVMEISYACAQYGFGDGANPLGVLDRVGMAFHKMYMRFLVDQAKRKLEKEIARSYGLQR